MKFCCATDYSIDINALRAMKYCCATDCSIDMNALRVGCKKLWALLKYLRSDFVVNALRTKQYIHRIRSIDIISLWEISDIARRAFISIENETPPSALARRAFISIENGPPSYSVARRASTKKGTNNF